MSLSAREEFLFSVWLFLIMVSIWLGEPTITTALFALVRAVYKMFLLCIMGGRLTMGMMMISNSEPWLLWTVIA